MAGRDQLARAIDGMEFSVFVYWVIATDEGRAWLLAAQQATTRHALGLGDDPFRRPDDIHAARRSVRHGR